MDENLVMKACPFCGFVVSFDDYIDAVHPIRVRGAREIWQAGCLTIAGGCDASVLGDSKEDAIKNWNRRHKEE
jgi:hypothetical protein